MPCDDCEYFEKGRGKRLCIHSPSTGEDFDNSNTMDDPWCPIGELRTDLFRAESAHKLSTRWEKEALESKGRIRNAAGAAVDRYRDAPNDFASLSMFIELLEMAIHRE